MNAYHGLPDIADVIPRSAADDALFAELAEVLSRHGARDRFGVVLLHTHFPIGDGEILVEDTDVLSRTQTIKPVIGRPARTIETSWRLGPNGEAITNCICPEDRNGNHLGSHISKP